MKDFAWQMMALEVLPATFAASTKLALSQYTTKLLTDGINKTCELMNCCKHKQLALGYVAVLLKTEQARLAFHYHATKFSHVQRQHLCAWRWTIGTETDLCLLPRFRVLLQLL